MSEKSHVRPRRWAHVASIGWLPVVVLAGIACVPAIVAAVAAEPPKAEGQSLSPPVEMTAQQDHKRLMGLLKMDSIRRGADGFNRSAPNAANLDESKATPYPDLPEVLTLKSGQKVASADTWWKQRRGEIVEDFDREVYGRVPKDVPGVKWEVTETKRQKVGDVPVVVKRIVGHVDNSAYPAITVDIPVTLTTPAEAIGPVPVIMEFGFDFGMFGPPGKSKAFPGKAAKPGAGKAPQPTKSVSKGKMASPGFGPGFGPGGFGPPPGPSWQQQVLAKGWGYAIIVPTAVQADNGGGLTRGIIGLCNKGQPRKVDDWGALRAWAWGASRALDYFETDKDVDAKRVGIEGLSRYGKAAIVTMAYDQRFAIGFIGSSGAGGAKLHRRDFGERVENVAGSGEYHWMAGNYIKYAGPLTAKDLPVDAHELVALCAPRPVLISVGSQQVEGGWVDAKGMFLAAVEACPVYELLGKKGLGASQMPPQETALVDGEVAFRQHAGGHTTGPNWPTFLKWAERYFRTTSAPAAPGAGNSQPGQPGQPGPGTGRVIDLFDGKSLVGWKPQGDAARSKWMVGHAKIAPGKPREFVVEPATSGGELVNAGGGGVDLFTTAKVGDCTLEIEFMVPEHSNSGVYVMGEYEIQVLDGYGATKLTPGSLGGVYGAAAPKVNAAKKPGEWQKFVIEYKAPRYEGDKKVANAKLIKVTLNGQLIHENLEVRGPTPGGVTGREAATGPLKLQGDHGPVAYRNIRVILPAAQ